MVSKLTLWHLITRRWCTTAGRNNLGFRWLRDGMNRTTPSTLTDRTLTTWTSTTRWKKWKRCPICSFWIISLDGDVGKDITNMIQTSWHQGSNMVKWKGGWTVNIIFNVSLRPPCFWKSDCMMAFPVFLICTTDYQLLHRSGLENALMEWELCDTSLQEIPLTCSISIHCSFFINGVHQSHLNLL